MLRRGWHRFGMSIDKVRNHIQAIYRKLHTNSKGELQALALQRRAGGRLAARPLRRCPPARLVLQYFLSIARRGRNRYLCARRRDHAGAGEPWTQHARMRQFIQAAGRVLRGRQLLRCGLLAVLAAGATPALARGATPPAAKPIDHVTAVPFLISVMPGMAPVGSTISLFGLNLTSIFTITFKNSLGVPVATAAFGYSVNPMGTQISNIVVPAGAVTGTIEVQTFGGNSNPVPFTVTAPVMATPALTSLSPTIAQVGDVLLLNGTALTGTTLITFAGTSNNTVSTGYAVNAAGTQITGIVVPAGAVSGNVTATTPTVTTNALPLSIVVNPLLVTGRTPARNAVSAAVTVSPVFTFSQPLSAATAGNVRVFSGQRGGQLVRGGNATASGNTLTVNPAANLRPGETVLLTVPASVTSSGGRAALPQVQQFTAAVLPAASTGHFAGSTDVAVGSVPKGVTAADVDGDGDLDLLAANDASASVSVGLNNGNGTFAATTSVAVGFAPGSVVAADVDDDGDLDLLVANVGAGTVSVRFNNGSGSFSGTTDVAVGSTPKGVAVADVDGDGDLDFLTANAGNNTVSVRYNNGSGSFSGSTSAAVGSQPYSVAVGDLDSDGDLDLLTANNGDNSVSVRLNNGGGSFFGSTELAVGAMAFSVVAADVDSDGDLDVLAGSFGSGVSVRLNNGSASFSGTTDVGVGQADGIAASDVDGDGDLDLVAVNYNSFGTVEVRLNDGSGTFSGGSSVAVGGAPSGLAMADLNGDGALDILTANNNSNDVSVRLNGYRDLVVTTGTPGSPTPIFPGIYDDITVDNGAVGQLIGDLAPAGNVLVRTGGTLLTNCGTLTGPGSFTLQAGATLGICDPDGLDANTGAILMTGTVTLSNDARYLYNGTMPQITGNELPALVRDLTTTNNQPLTLTQPLAVDQALTVAGAGNFALNGQPLTLVSDATGTALVVNSGTGIVTGNTATMFRYLDTPNLGNGYRQYSSPVSGNTLADLSTPGFVPTFNPAYNTSAASANTFPFPTVFGYDQGRLASPLSSYTGFDRGWYSPAATDFTVPGVGYTVNIAGTQTEGFTGTLNTGPYTRTLTRDLSRAAGSSTPGTLARGAGPDAGWALVGNPYPAPLDWSRVTPASRPNLDGSIYVFESTGPYAGQYRPYTNGVGQSPLIGSSQSFFVRVSPGQTSGSINFGNAQRIITFGSQAPVRRDRADPRPFVRLALAGAGTTDALYLYAEAGATPGLDPAFDAAKLPNPGGLNLASLTAAGEALAIDGRAAFGPATVVPLQVAVPAAGTYTLRTEALANLAGTAVTLVDNLTGTRTLLAAGTAYAFTTATGTAPGRFYLSLTTAGALGTAAALQAQVLAYPNPTHGTLTVLRPAGPAATGTLLNALGQPVRTLALPTAETVLDLRGLAPGLYTLRLQTGTVLVVKRVVLE